MNDYFAGHIWQYDATIQWTSCTPAIVVEYMNYQETSSLCSSSIEASRVSYVWSPNSVVSTSSIYAGLVRPKHVEYLLNESPLLGESR